MSKITVSFTSYPERIKTIDKILDSIINQTVLPDRIVLYLYAHEFYNYIYMPNLKKYERYGFEIHWCKENLKSHKKWFYALQEYSDDLIITIDDDILYNKTMIENLLKYHNSYPSAIIARRAHLITCNSDNSIAPYSDWYLECSLYVGTPRMDMMATTGAGTLFPPYIFEKEILNKEIFMEICPYADDIWLKVMEVYCGIPVVLAEKTWEDCPIKEYQDNGLFGTYNKKEGNDKQFNTLLEYYKNTVDGKNLKNCFFPSKPLLSPDVRRLKTKERRKALDLLVSKICSTDELLVYGAGLMGKQIYKLLQYKKIEKINAFIVSNIIDNLEFIGDVPVVCYKKFIRSHENIIIALLDSYESYKLCVQLMNEGVSYDRFIFLNRLEKQALMEV